MAFKGNWPCPCQFDLPVRSTRLDIDQQDKVESSSMSCSRQGLRRNWHCSIVNLSSLIRLAWDPFSTICAGLAKTQSVRSMVGYEPLEQEAVLLGAQKNIQHQADAQIQRIAWTTNARQMLPTSSDLISADKRRIAMHIPSWRSPIQTSTACRFNRSAMRQEVCLPFGESPLGSTSPLAPILEIS